MDKLQVIAATLFVAQLAVADQAHPQESRAPAENSVKSGDHNNEGAIIAKIAFVGERRVPVETLRAAIGSRAGDKFDSARIDSDVRALGRLGWFESVRADVDDVADPPTGCARTHEVRLVFYVDENPFLTRVEYVGSRLLGQQQIERMLAEKKLKPQIGEPLDPMRLHRIAGAIKTALAELGHPEAEVQAVKTEFANATARVRFEIADGPHLPVGRVSFAGNTGVSPKVLRRQMRRVAPNAFFAALRARDSYTREGFAEDRERILTYYRNHGFPEARVGEAQVSRYESFSRRWLVWPHRARSSRLAITVPVEAGPLYTVGSVEASDALARVGKARRNPKPESFGLEPGQPYSAQAIENFRRAWQVRAQPKLPKGDTASYRNVEARQRMDTAGHTLRIDVRVSGTPYIVRRLEFQGMHRFPDRYFRRRILLREGAPFDDHALEAGLARLARTGYFQPIKKEDVHVETDDARHTVDVAIRVEERGQQRASLVGGRGQFGSTLGIAYTVFNLLDRDELLSSQIEGGPESLQLALGLAKEGFLGSRGSLALSVFDTFLRPRLTGSAKGPFFKTETRGINANWSYALTNVDALSVSYGLSRSMTQYSPAVPAGATGVTLGDLRTGASSHAVGLGWTRTPGDERIVASGSVSGGWLGGSENIARASGEYSKIARDQIMNHRNAWAFRTVISGAGSYSGDMPLYARMFPGDEYVRGLREGELGPKAVVSSLTSQGVPTYAAAPAGADLVGAANLEYRVPLAGGTEAAGFFDAGSGWLLPNWLGGSRPLLIESTNGMLHGSTGVELRWTVPGLGVPVRAYYALNLPRLNRHVPMPDGSLFPAHDRLAALGWGLGSLF